MAVTVVFKVCWVEVWKVRRVRAIVDGADCKVDESDSDRKGVVVTSDGISTTLHVPWCLEKKKMIPMERQRFAATR